MTETVAAGQLRAVIERIERVEAEIKDLNADKSEIYKEARGVGFDVKAIRQCVAARKLDSSEREERNAIFDLYWSALGGHVHVHTPARENIEKFPITETHMSEPSKASDAAGAAPTAPAPLLPDRATPGEDCPPSKPNPETACAKNDDAANVVIGQSHGRGNSGQAAPISDDVPAFLLKDRPPLRPLCLNPSECAGYGTHTCHRCLMAAGRAEVAA